MNSFKQIEIKEDKEAKCNEIWNTYDSLLEINLTTGITNVTFYNDEDTKISYKTSDLKNELAAIIYDRDRKKINRLLSERSLKAIIKNKYTKRLELRFCSNEENKRLRMLLTPIFENDNNTVLCYNYIVKVDKKNERMMLLNTDFSNLIKKAYRSIYIVDLRTGFATVFKNSEAQDMEGEIINWNNYINGFIDNVVCYDDKKVINENFDVYGLKNLYKSERNEFYTDIRRKTSDFTYYWVEIGVKFSTNNENVMAYVTERDSDKLHQLQAIVEEFVYKNSDYVICLDAENNCYSMFNYGNNGTPIPPKKSDDFTSDIRAYIREYVVEEDMDFVINNLIIGNMIMQLQTSEDYSFSFGVIANGEYSRKLIKYVYYDKLNKIILLRRNDITEQYLEHKARSDSLRLALESAQKDSLTQIYNRETVKELINKKLNEINGRLAAMLFLDLDNFKEINDNLGHSEGDFALKVVADSLNRSVRCTDFVGRFGGDEFIVFLSGIATKGEVLRCVERIFKCFDNINNEYAKGKNVRTFSCSIGIAFSPEHGQDFDILVNKADMALYKSKRMGKNCCSIYSENIQY